MHEYHVVEGIVKQAIQAARMNNALRVIKIMLSIGGFSGFEEGSVRLYFEDLSKGTIVEGAKLVAKAVKAELRCEKCSTVFEYTRGEFNCPQCGSLAVPTENSKKIYIETIEIEKR